MKRSSKIKLISAIIVLVIVAALVAVASGGAGAYFSDSKSGTVTGTVGTIKVSTSGGSGDNGLNLAFTNLLPGEPQTVTAYWQNTGNNPVDVWLVFSNKTALSALNSLGTYGEAHIAASGTEIFASKNLNDHPVDQGAVATDGSIVRMVPEKIKIASNIAPGGSGSMSFTFAYASKLGGSGGGVWNTYPLATPGTPAGTGWPNDGNQAGYDQHYANASDGSGDGLPYKIYAVQVGQQP